MFLGFLGLSGSGLSAGAGLGRVGTYQGSFGLL